MQVFSAPKSKEILTYFIFKILHIVIFSQEHKARQTCVPLASLVGIGDNNLNSTLNTQAHIFIPQLKHVHCRGVFRNKTFYAFK